MVELTFGELKQGLLCCTVYKDCAGTSIEAHAAALKVMQSCHVEVRNEEVI